MKNPHFPARISHQSSTAADDAQRPAAFSRIGVLGGLRSTSPRPSCRKRNRALHLVSLATTIAERYGLAIMVVVSITLIMFGAGLPLSAQVQPLKGGRSQRSGVDPLPNRPRLGQVTPLAPETPPDEGVKILAIGRAPIRGGDVSRARTAALRAAYAEAVSRGAGISVGSLTIITNMKAVSDVITTRTRGFVRSYNVISEGIAADDHSQYEIRIEAIVVANTASADVEAEALRLYLEILGNPTILVMLPQYGNPVPADTGAAAEDKVEIEYRSGTTELSVRGPKPEPVNKPTPVDTAGQFTGAEAAIAQAFSRLGYRVRTSDDVAATTGVAPDVLARARRGITEDALIVAHAANADLALIGVMQVSGQRIQPYGVDMASVTGEASAKAMVVSSGLLVEAFHRTVTKAHSSPLGATSAVLDRIAEEFATALAWRIPSILVENHRETRLVIDGVTFDEADRIKRSMTDLPDIEAVRFLRIPAENNPQTELLLLTGFVRVDAYRLVEAIQGVVGNAYRVTVVREDKYGLQVRVE